MGEDWRLEIILLALSSQKKKKKKKIGNRVPPLLRFVNRRRTHGIEICIYVCFLFFSIFLGAGLIWVIAGDVAR